ncbi:MAG: hypothetical protein K0Q55_2445 [Verrucomicrobia bacterium]|jgi:hypothetical protein|nr:hypothetical protein [Verrucomicrobiota bacterium]
MGSVQWFMKQLLLMALLAVLCGCHTPDYTKGESSTCEVHQVAMTRRTVPIAYGMIPMSKAEAGQGEWKRRTEQYPHPGDCLPATDINLHGEKRAVVYVCAQCEQAQRTSSL